MSSASSAGAGVVGLGIARRLAMAGREVLVLEAQHAIGTGTSSRNSEVIHAGIYYAEGTLKARLCVAGRHQLYAYCASHGVPARAIGKLIVATHRNQLPHLDALLRLGRANGVHDLQMIDAAGRLKLEPALFSVGALLSPSTGIVDSHALMLAYQADAESAGAVVVLGAPIVAGEVSASGFLLHIGGSEPTALACHTFINAAGLSAPLLASRLNGLAATCVPPSFLCKGSYYTLSGRAPFNASSTPCRKVPEWACTSRSTSVARPDSARTSNGSPGRTMTSILRVPPAFMPRYDDTGQVSPMARCSPVMQAYGRRFPRPGEPPADFMIAGPDQHGIAGLVNLFGIESPGLTASFAIADHVAHLLKVL